MYTRSDVCESAEVCISAHVEEFCTPKGLIVAKQASQTAAVGSAVISVIWEVLSAAVRRGLCCMEQSDTDSVPDQRSGSKDGSFDSSKTLHDVQQHQQQQYKDGLQQLARVKAARHINHLTKLAPQAHTAVHALLDILHHEGGICVPVDIDIQGAASWRSVRQLEFEALLDGAGHALELFVAAHHEPHVADAMPALLYLLEQTNNIMEDCFLSQLQGALAAASGKLPGGDAVLAVLQHVLPDLTASAEEPKGAMGCLLGLFEIVQFACML